MRFSRSLLLDQLTGGQAPAVALLEAPSGYGKSWLLRQAWGSGALRLRGELGPLVDEDFRHDGRVVIDDAHRLSDDDIERLVEYIEFADDDLRLFIAGRLLPDALHDVVRLVDGIVLDASALALTADELTSDVSNLTPSTAEQLIEITDGCIRTIATAIEQTARQAGANPVALASRIVRASASSALQQLDASGHAVVAVLARSPGVDRHLIDNVAGRDAIPSFLQADVPLRRHAMGGFEVATPNAFRGADLDASLARRLSDALITRQRPIDAVELLLDAGEPDEAARVMSGLNESVVDSLEPRALLGMLARLGAFVNHDPSLLLIRATATRGVGRLDDAIRDIELAASLATSQAPALKRRIDVEAADVHLNRGQLVEAKRAAEQALSDIETGEERTFARAHQILAECDTRSNKPANLQRAVESYRIAASTWKACGEHTRARVCRRDMTWGALISLGRYDEALTQLEELLTEVDISDAERSVILFAEATVMWNAGRLQGAEQRFQRVGDLGVVQDNPRLVAAGAWGRALVASTKGDLKATRQWIATAENTALTHGDDLLGVPFLCDVVEMLGALGSIDEASRYLKRLKESAPLFPDEVKRAEFVLAARQGIVGDIDVQLEQTPPHERWRVQLVSAHAAARSGDLSLARQLLESSKRELAALGFDSPALRGEQREYDALIHLLQLGEESTASDKSADGGNAYRDASPRASNCRLNVTTSPMTVDRDGTLTPIPPGNPQRLVGVVVAHGGSATFDQVGEAVWPGQAVEITRSRLRNVLLRLRRAAGDVVTRTSTGVRLDPTVSCDLDEFDRLAADALSVARSDPELAGQLGKEALQRVAVTDGIFNAFQYEEWSMDARRRTEQKMIDLLDLLSIQAQDEGDLALAQTYAERALGLDRYTDSRYVRLAELLALQDRSAAAIAVLDDAATIARESGMMDDASDSIGKQRQDLLRRTASGR